MRRALAPAEVPAAAWQHIRALPELWAARNALQEKLRQRRALTASYWLQMSRLSAISRETLHRETTLMKLGVPLDQISDLAAPAPQSYQTEH